MQYEVSGRGCQKTVGFCERDGGEHVHGSEDPDVQEEWRVCDVVGRATVLESGELREVQRGIRESQDVGFQAADVTNNAEETRGCC